MKTTNGQRFININLRGGVMGNEQSQLYVKIYRFLSLLLRDELSKDIVVVMGKKDFVIAFCDVLKQVGIQDWDKAASLFGEAFENNSPEELFRKLRFEYAEMFLGVGIDPVFPYESVHMTGLPLVRQKNVFELREIYRQAEVRIDPSYKDLEEHIAVELECLAYCIETNREAEAKSLSSRLQGWGPKFLSSCTVGPNPHFIARWQSSAPEFWPLPVKNSLSLNHWKLLLLNCR